MVALCECVNEWYCTVIFDALPRETAREILAVARSIATGSDMEDIDYVAGVVEEALRGG